MEPHNKKMQESLRNIFHKFVHKKNEFSLVDQKAYWERKQDNASLKNTRTESALVLVPMQR